MTQVSAALAQYVLSLAEASANTHRAEDRPLYQSYLAEAGILLALACAGADHQTIQQKVAQHERLWGTTWLQDPAYDGPSRAWRAFKDVYGEATII